MRGGTGGAVTLAIDRGIPYTYGMKTHAWSFRPLSPLVALVFAASVCAAFAGCAKNAKARHSKISMVIAGSFGDDSFFDGALRGFLKAVEDFGLDYETIECRDQLGRFEAELVGASERADIVAVLGYQFFETVQDVARSRPGVKFLYLDGPIDGIGNLTSVDFIEAEGAYLAGTLAAIVTSSPDMPKANPQRRVGIVGGMDIPVIRDFVEGFLAGVSDADPEAEAFVSFAGSFVDREAAYKAAAAMYAAGADVVFQAAGGAGLGVFQAAKEADRYAIGVDIDQRPNDPERILASMVKNAGLALYKLIDAAANGSLVAGAYKYGLQGGIISLDYGEGASLVPEAIAAKVRLAEAELVSGARRAAGR